MLASASALATSLPVAAFAADAAATSDAAATIEEVVVTAEKRVTNLQNTALAVSAIGGEDMKARQLTNVQALAQNLPNVNFGQITGNARIAVRGVGFDNISVGNEARVAFHVDGVYVSRPSGALANFYDIERIEVVRGPQGTLYGRNATGGAVNVITRDPTEELSGYLTATAGNYDTYNLEAAVSGKLFEGVSGRLAVQTANHSGYGENITTGLEVDDLHARSVRGKLKFELSPDVTWNLGADYVTQRDHSSGYHFFGAGSFPVPPSTTPAFVPKGPLFGGAFAPDVRDTSADQGPFYRRENYSLTSDLGVQSDLVDLRFITGFRNTRYHQITDLDNTNAPLTRYDQAERSRQFSQEVRASKTLERGDWVIGAYYFSERLVGYTALPFDLRLLNPANPARFVQGYFAGGAIQTDAWAIFGQARYKLTDELALVVGGRYSTERKSIEEVAQLDTVRPYNPANPVIPRAVNGTQDRAATWNGFTPKVTVEYKPVRNIFLFATYSKGFKSGGFNLGGVQAPFRPEKLTDYEVGLKADWLDGRLRTNLGAFKYDYADLQVSKVNGAVVTIENAATARIKGVEAEVIFLPIDNLRVELNGAWLDAKYRSYTSPDPARPGASPQLAGHTLTQAPRYTASAAVQYRWASSVGDFTFRAEERFVDRYYFTPYNTSVASQPSFHMTNLFVTYDAPAGNWSATAYLRNAEDKRVISSALVGSTTFAGAPVTGTLEPPRTFGLQLDYRF
jgi:iron complex outermembrane receptor protein